MHDTQGPCYQPEAMAREGQASPTDMQGCWDVTYHQDYRKKEVELY